MPSLKDNFNELIKRINYGRELGHASFEPIYYLVFSQSQILDVKRQLPSWVSKLKNDGWYVGTFSIAEGISSIIKQSSLRKMWINADSKSPMNWEKTNQSIANAISKGALLKKIEEKLFELEKEKKSILIVTDIEALHPYMRIGTIETQLMGKFNVPTIFLYPGERTGKTRLKFLGFYPDDGNYRSVHVGG